jgi:hypothetical protein
MMAITTSNSISVNAFRRELAMRDLQRIKEY